MALEIKHLQTQTHELMESAGNIIDEISRLCKENADLKEAQRWRKFSDEKPKEKQWILVYYPNHSNFTTGVEVRRWDEGCKYDVELQEVYDKWMPLPKAPEDE